MHTEFAINQETNFDHQDYCGICDKGKTCAIRDDITLAHRPKQFGETLPSMSKIGILSLGGYKVTKDKFNNWRKTDRSHISNFITPGYLGLYLPFVLWPN